MTARSALTCRAIETLSLPLATAPRRVTSSGRGLEAIATAYLFATEGRACAAARERFASRTNTFLWRPSGGKRTADTSRPCFRTPIWDSCTTEPALRPAGYQQHRPARTGLSFGPPDRSICHPPDRRIGRESAFRTGCEPGRLALERFLNEQFVGVRTCKPFLALNGADRSMEAAAADDPVPALRRCGRCRGDLDVIQRAP